MEKRGCLLTKNYTQPTTIVWIYCLTSRLRQDYVLSLKEQVDVHGRRAVVLHALPPYLCEDDSKFLETWDIVILSVQSCLFYEFWKNKVVTSELLPLHIRLFWDPWGMRAAKPTQWRWTLQIPQNSNTQSSNSTHTLRPAYSPHYEIIR